MFKEIKEVKEIGCPLDGRPRPSTVEVVTVANRK